MARLYVLSGDDLGAVREAASGAVIGRGRDVEIPVRGASISRRHARLEERGGRWYVVDLGSSNGTRVGGRAVEEAALEDGEEFLLGDVEVRFRLGVQVPGPTPVPPEIDADGALQRAETTFLPPSAPPDDASEEFELEGDWDESAPPPRAPAAPAASPRPAPAPRAPTAKPDRDTARRRAAAMGGATGGARATTSATTSGGRILQYQRVENRPGLLGADLAQLPAAVRFGLYALVLVVVAALAWGAFQLTASAKRASASSSSATELDEG